MRHARLMLQLTLSGHPLLPTPVFFSEITEKYELYVFQVCDTMF